MALTEKQRKALREKAEKEAAERAAREEAEIGSRRRRREPGTGIQGPPPGLIAVLVLLAMIGGAIALGFWLSSADSPLGVSALPEDVGTSPEKGGYISDEGLPGRYDEHEVAENPAGKENLSDEDGEGQEPGQDGYGDGSQDGSEDGTDGNGTNDLVSVHVLPYMMGGLSPEDYAMARGWPVGVVQEDGSAVYSVTAEQQMLAVEQVKSEMDAMMAGIASSGVLDSVAYANEEEYETFTAYALGGHETDKDGWCSALRQVLAKSAERSALAGNNNPTPSATVYAGSPDGDPTVAGSAFLVSGDVVANLVDGG